MKKILPVLIFTLLFFIFVLPQSAYAQGWSGCTETVKISVPDPDNPDGSPITENHEVLTLRCIPNLFQILVSAGMTFAGIVALFFIIWGGYKLAFSGGDAEKIKGARGTITYAILGLVLVFLSYFIVNLIAQATGLSCLSYFGLNQCGTSSSGKPFCPVDKPFSDSDFPYGRDECDCPSGTSSNGTACVRS